MSQQCFILCRDDVTTKGHRHDKGSLIATETAEARGQGVIGAWLRPRNFGSQQEIGCVAIGFDGVVSRQSNSMSRHSWSGLDNFLSRQSLPSQEFSVATECFYIVTECGQIEKFCVAIEKFYVPT